jgi:hypothetical protein
MFNSLSHGVVPFGFYNIETDGLLLGQHFFFCTDFCRMVKALFEKPLAEEADAALSGHVFHDPQRIGNLKGAINGSLHTGFFGEIYRVWPFPEAPEIFRQKLHCFDNRGHTLGLLGSMADPVEIQVVREANFRQVQIGPYHFTLSGFVRLLQYIVRGGYPTWEEDGGRQLPEALLLVGQLLTQHKGWLMEDS